MSKTRFRVVKSYDKTSSIGGIGDTGLDDTCLIINEDTSNGKDNGIYLGNFDKCIANYTSVGIGLIGNDTIKVALVNETKSTFDASATASTNANRLYPVSLDKNGKLAVNVPWGNTVVDTSLSSTSTNPVQNKVINLALNNKMDKVTLATVATTGSYNDLSNTPTIPTIPSSLPSNGIINAYSTYRTNAAISISQAIRFDTMMGEDLLGSSKSTGYHNAILSISRFEDDQYTTQLGFSGNGIYARIFSGETPDTSTSWKTMIMDDGSGNVTANAYYISSDERLKTFGDDIKVDFDELAKLRKSHFVFNDNPTKQEIGVSAQEVQKIYPEIVNETEEGTLSVDYSKLAVIALAAIDKLNQRIQELENKLIKYE